MKLLVNRWIPGVDDGPRLRPDVERPALRVIQGGLARPRRSARSSPARSVPPPGLPAADPGPRMEEIPIYLRPLPAWVPRLW